MRQRSGIAAPIVEPVRGGQRRRLVLCKHHEAAQRFRAGASDHALQFGEQIRDIFEPLPVLTTRPRDDFS